MSSRVAIIAALEREVKPTVENWRIIDRDYDGGNYRFFENDRAVLVCAGIGPEPGRRATEAIISLYHPVSIISAGFAGALHPELKVGDLFKPRYVINASDGSRTDTGTGSGTLVSSPWIVGREQKLKLANSYSAQAVDMESASVALGAQARAIPFTAVKAISDELDFPMPALDRFVSRDGQFHALSFVWFAAVRPWLWPRILRLARNTDRAVKSLCAWLNQYNQPEFVGKTAARFDPIRHPINKVNR